MKTTYWNNNGRHQQLADALQKLIPYTGSIKNPTKNKQLERFRKAVNTYYDLYNNGLYNRKTSFSKIFRITASEYEYHRGEFSPQMYEMTEVAMDEIILQAAKEQSITAV